MKVQLFPRLEENDSNEMNNENACSLEAALIMADTEKEIHGEAILEKDDRGETVEKTKVVEVGGVC